MKFCANCGQQLPYEAAFCPMCGTAANPEASDAASCRRQPEEPAAQVQPDIIYTPSYGSSGEGPAARAPRAKKSGKKRAGIIIAVIAILVAAAAAVSVFATGANIALMSDSVKKLEACQKNMVSTICTVTEKIAGTDGIASSANTLSFKDVDLIGDSTAEYLLKQFELNFGISGDKDGSLISLEPGFSGSELTSLYLRLDGESVGICVPDFREELYVINSDELIKMLDLNGGPNSGASGSEKIEDTLLDVIGIVCGVANEDNTEITKNVNLSIFGGDDTCKVSLYTIRPTGSDVKAVLLNLIDYTEDNRNTFLYTIANACFMLSDSYYDDISEFFDYLRDEAAEISEFFDDRAVSFEIAIKGKAVVMQRVVVESDYEDEGGSAFGCFMRRKGKTFRFMAFGGSYENGFDSAGDNLEYSSIFDIEASFSGNKLEVEGAVRDGYNDEAAALLSFELDFGSRSPLGFYCGSSELRIVDEDIVISLDVSEDGGTTEHYFEIVSDGDTFSFSIESAESADVSLPDNVNEVILASEEEIESLAEEFVDDYLYGEIIGQLIGLLGGGFGFEM